MLRYRVLEPFWGKSSCKTFQIVWKVLIKGFQLFYISINVVLTFEFCHNITIWKMTILNLNQHYCLLTTGPLCATGVHPHVCKLKVIWPSHFSLALKAPTISPLKSTDCACDRTKRFQVNILNQTKDSAWYWRNFPLPCFGVWAFRLQASRTCTTSQNVPENKVDCSLGISDVYQQRLV